MYTSTGNFDIITSGHILSKFKQFELCVTCSET